VGGVDVVGGQPVQQGLIRVVEHDVEAFLVEGVLSPPPRAHRDVTLVGQAAGDDRDPRELARAGGGRDAIGAHAVVPFVVSPGPILVGAGPPPPGRWTVTGSSPSARRARRPHPVPAGTRSTGSRSPTPARVPRLRVSGRTW